MALLGLLAPLLLVSAAGAQAECAEGRVRGPEGRCCWPSQTFSSSTGRCEGVPACPAGLLEHGETCVAPAREACVLAPGAGTGEPAIPEASAASGTSYVPVGYDVLPGAAAAVASSTASWATLTDLPIAAEVRHPRTMVGEDEGLITVALSIFDTGWVLGWLIALLDETTGSCRATWDWASPRVSCESWPLSFVPVVGGLLSGITNYQGVRFTSGFGIGFGSVSVILQVVGLIATAVGFANGTTEHRLELLDEVEGDGTSVALTFDAPGADGGTSLAIRF